MNPKISEYFDIREFISKQTWDRYGNQSFWFVQHRIINSCKLLHRKIADRYDIPQTDVTVVINNWYKTSDTQNSYEYEGFVSGNDNAKLYEMGKLNDDDYDSFHRQGHAVNVKVNVKINNKIEKLTSYDIAVIILEHEDDFVLNGLTVIGEPRKNKYELHLDCRNTRSFKLKII